MIDVTIIINIFFTGFYEAVLLLGGLVLRKGLPPRALQVSPLEGSLALGTRPTQIQRYFSYMLLYSAVALVIDLYINKVYVNHSIAWDYLCIILDCIAMGFSPMQSKVLRQQRPGLKDWLYSFVPVLPLAIAVPLSYSSCPAVLRGLAFLTFLFMACRNLWVLVILKRWDKMLKNEYSEVEYKETGWFFRLCIAVFCVMLLLLPIDVDAGLGWRETLFYILMSFLFMQFVYHALRQEEWIASPPCLALREDIPGMHESGVCSTSQTHTCEEMDGVGKEAEDVQVSTAQDNQENLPSWVSKLETLMTDDDIYKNPELNLTELAKAVGTNRSYLSKYFNETLSMTFYDYINNARLRHAEEMLLTTDSTQDVIAAECGFKSRIALHRVFRKTHGMSPTEWRGAESSAGKIHKKN